MSERKYAAKDGEKETKSNQGINTRHRTVHPILQLQQLVGNRTVTKMIQRQDETAEEAEGQNFRENPGYQAWRERMVDAMNATTIPLNKALTEAHASANSIDSAEGKWNNLAATFREGKP